MTYFGMFLLSCFAIAAALSFWLYWRERQAHRLTKAALLLWIDRAIGASPSRTMRANDQPWSKWSSGDRR